MKYAQRSAAAIATATLVGGAGIAAAVTGINGASASTGGDEATSAVVDAAQRHELSKALSTLAHSERTLEQQLRHAKRDLARLQRELRHQRALGRVPIPAYTPSTPSYPSDDSDDPTTSSGDGQGDDSDDPTPPSDEPTPTPPTDTQTGASGGGDDDDTGGTDDTGGDDGYGNDG